MRLDDQILVKDPGQERRCDVYSSSSLPQSPSSAGTTPSILSRTFGGAPCTSIIVWYHTVSVTALTSRISQSTTPTNVKRDKKNTVASTRYSHSQETKRYWYGTCSDEETMSWLFPHVPMAPITHRLYIECAFLFWPQWTIDAPESSRAQTWKDSTV